MPHTPPAPVAPAATASQGLADPAARARLLDAVRFDQHGLVACIAQ